MNRIDIKAVVIAFVAEFCVDIVVMSMLIGIFGRGQLDPDMAEAEFKAALEAINAQGDFQLAAFVSGMVTVVLGGYLVARIAKGFPYYNGLAIGVVSVVFTLAFAAGNPLWFTILAVLLTIPLSIYGAHLARKHRPVQTDGSR